jgi:hypothetical protein
LSSGRSSAGLALAQTGMKQRHPPNSPLGAARTLDSGHMIDENPKCAAPVAGAPIPKSRESRALHRTRKKLRVSGSVATDVLVSGLEGWIGPLFFWLCPHPGRLAWHAWPARGLGLAVRLFAVEALRARWRLIWWGGGEFTTWHARRPLSCTWFPST